MEWPNDTVHVTPSGAIVRELSGTLAELQALGTGRVAVGDRAWDTTAGRWVKCFAVAATSRWVQDHGDPGQEVKLWEDDFDAFDPTANGWVDTGTGTDRSLTGEATAPGIVVLPADTGGATNYGGIRRGIAGLDLSAIELDMVWRFKVTKPFDATDTGAHFIGVNDSNNALGSDYIGLYQVNGNANWQLATRGGGGTATLTALSGSGVAVPSDTWQWVRILSQPGTPLVTVFIGATYAALASVGTYAGAEVPAAGELCGANAWCARTNAGSNNVHMRIDYTRGIARFITAR